MLGSSGRFAVYDTTALNIDTLSAIGQPDLNAFTKLASVQGYGSILSGAYGAATGTHTLDTLNPCALAQGAFVPLRLASLLTLPAYLAPGVEPNGQAPPPPAACPGAPVAGTSGRRTFYLGWTVDLSSASLVRTAGTGSGDTGLAGPLQVGILGPTGTTTWPTESVTGTATSWSVRFARPQPAVALVVSGPASSVSDTSVVTASDGQRWALDGVLQEALDTSGWRFVGTWNDYARFAQSRVVPPVWVAAPTQGARGPPDPYD